MIRRVLGNISTWLTRDSAEEGGEDDEDTEGSNFLPSRLDASVLEAHGIGTKSAERELAQIQEKAEQLEEQDRNR